MSIYPDPNNLLDQVTDYIDNDAALKETTKTILPPINNRLSEPDTDGIVENVGEAIDGTVDAVNDIGFSVTESLQNIEQQLINQTANVVNGVLHTALPDTQSVTNNSTTLITNNNTTVDKELFEVPHETIPDKFLNSLISALNSGDWNITKLLLDKIQQECPGQPIGDSIVKEDLTMLEYCGTTGNTALYDSLVEARYGPADIERRKNAHEKLIHAATVSKENKEDASTLQLLFLLQYVGKLKDKHALTGRYYNVRHMFLFFLPGAILSAVAALLSFLSTSTLTSSISNLLGIVVGCLASLSALIQTISDQLGYSSITVQHESAAHEMDGILQSLNFSFVDSISGGKLPITEHELQTIKKQVTSIELTCKTPVPQYLDSFYETMVNELYWFRRGAKVEIDDEADLSLTSKSIEDTILITQTIVNSPFWPWFFNPSKVRAKILSKYRAELMDYTGNKNEESTFFQLIKQYEGMVKPVTASEKYSTNV